MTGCTGFFENRCDIALELRGLPACKSGCAKNDCKAKPGHLLRWYPFPRVYRIFNCKKENGQVPVAQTPGLATRAVGRETPLAVGGTIRVTHGKEGASHTEPQNRRVVIAGATVR